MKSILILAIICLVSNAMYDGDSKVVKLTNDNFEKDVLKKSDLWFIEFYAPW